MSGSKDKLVNTHAQVTYVFACLPGSFSSPSPIWSLHAFVSCRPPPFTIFTSFLFSPSVFESKMNFRTRQTVIPRRGIELASVKCTKLHFSHETDPSVASLPGVYTLNRVVDCFNAACLRCVKNNKLLSYSAITPVLRKGSAPFCCRTARASSNIDAPSSYSNWACTAVGHVWLLRLTLYCNLIQRIWIKRVNKAQNKCSVLHGLLNLCSAVFFFWLVLRCSEINMFSLVKFSFQTQGYSVTPFQDMIDGIYTSKEFTEIASRRKLLWFEIPRSTSRSQIIALQRIHAASIHVRYHHDNTEGI